MIFDRGVRTCFSDAGSATGSLNSLNMGAPLTEGWGGAYIAAEGGGAESEGEEGSRRRDCLAASAPLPSLSPSHHSSRFGTLN